MRWLWILFLLVPAAAAAVCGDNVTDPGEACDGTDLNGFSCTSVAAGYTGGTLACKSDCTTYNVSACTPGSTVAAASCSQGDVQTAIDSAVAGDTVTVPAGNCTWTASVDFGKSIVLQGAGIGQTVITRSGSGDQALHIEGQAGVPFRITGMEFNGNDGNVAIQIDGDGQTNAEFHNIRIHGNKFTNCDNRAILMQGYVDGVIDNNEFLDNEITDVVIFGDGATGWTRPVVLGGTDGVMFVEDNTFTWGCVGDDDPWHAVSTNAGARLVFRDNVLDAAFGACHVNSPIDAHGYCFSPAPGTVSYEIYNNTIDTETSNVLIQIRGGSGVIYSNTMIGPSNHDLFMTNYRSHQSCAGVIPPDTGDCHEVGGEGYPCLYQIGYNNEDLYYWDNTHGGPAGYTVRNIGEVPNDIVLDRDFHLSAKPGYVAYVHPYPLVNLQLVAQMALPGDPVSLVLSGNANAAMPGAPTGLSLSAAATPPEPGPPTGLSLIGNSIMTQAGDPTGLSLSGAATPVFPGPPTGLTL